MRANFLDLVSALNRSNIDAGLQSLSGLGFNVWLGMDHLDAVAIQHFRLEDLEKVVEWLHEAALRHYPHSAYARNNSPSH